MSAFYIWKREGNFWHRHEVSEEEYFSRACEAKEPMGKTFEPVGPTLSRHDGTKYREQQWK